MTQLSDREMLALQEVRAKHQADVIQMLCDEIDKCRITGVIPGRMFFQTFRQRLIQRGVIVPTQVQLWTDLERMDANTVKGSVGKA